MGNAQISQCKLSAAELNAHAVNTVFTPDEIKALWVHFKTICSMHETISRDQFQGAMLFHDSALLDRIYRIVDKDDDNKINFSEYLSCLSSISNKASKEEKLKFSFDLYDFDGDGLISVRDLTAVVAATLHEHQLAITRADIDHVVNQTMAEINPKTAGMISFEEYSTMVVARPHMLNQLSINVSSIIQEYTTTNMVQLTTPRGFASALNLHASKA